MNRIRSMVCVVVGALCAGGTLLGDEAVEFRFRMGPDDRLIYRSGNEVAQKQTLMGQTFETTFSQTELVEYTLQEIDDDGNLRVQIQNKGLSVKGAVGPLGEYVYDSNAAANDKGSTLGAALTPVYDAMRGAFIWITVDPRGEVLKAEGLKELLEGVLQDNALAMQFVVGSSEDGARLTYADRFIPFPDKALRPGDTWETPFEARLPGLGTLKGKRKFRYEGREDVEGRRLAKFLETQELSIDLDIDSPDAQVTGTLSLLESSGTYTFDPGTGRLVSKTATAKLAGDMTVRAAGVELTLRQEQTHKDTLELLDKLPE